jgi:hypothetical protein
MVQPPPVLLPAAMRSREYLFYTSITHILINKDDRHMLDMRPSLSDVRNQLLGYPITGSKVYTSHIVGSAYFNDIVDSQRGVRPSALAIFPVL